jgi:hypothetical protein
VSENPSLYDLFDANSLIRWKRLVSEGKLPTSEELAEIIEANASEPLPPWFIELVAKDLRGKLKRRGGRPKQHPLLQMRFAVVQAEFSRLLRWLRKRERTMGLGGWSILQQNDWWQGPPHERAARMVTARWSRHMSWRSFLNRVSSQQ